MNDNHSKQDGPLPREIYQRVLSDVLYTAERSKRLTLRAQIASIPPTTLTDAERAEIHERVKRGSRRW